MIEELILTGFRQYKKRTRIPFEPGLNLIQGENNAGKSTLFYAIFYALTNSALGFRSPKHLINFDSNEMTVELVIRGRDGNSYRITRMLSRSGSKYYKVDRLENGEVVPILDSRIGSRESDFHDFIIEKIGLSKRALELVAYAKQHEFIDIIKGKGQEIDYLFGITAIQTLSDAMAEVIKEIENELKEEKNLREQKKHSEELLNQFERDVTEAERQIREKEKEIRDLKEKLRREEDKERLAREEFEKVQKVLGLLGERTRLEEDLQEAMGDKKTELEYFKGRDPDRLLSEVESKIINLKSQKNAISDEIEKIRQALSEIDAEIKFHESIIEERKDVKDKAKCPKCGSSIDRKLVLEEIRKKEGLILKLKEKKKKKVEEKDRKIKARDGLDRDIRKLELEQQEIKDRVSRVKKLESRIEDIKDRIAGVDLEIEKIAPSVDLDKVDRIFSEAKDKYDKIRGKIIELKTQIKEKGEALGDLRGRLEEAIDRRAKEKDNYDRIIGRLKELQALREKKEEMERAQEVYSSSEKELRSYYTEILSQNVFYWYQELAAKHEFTRIEVDPRNYELLGVPVNGREALPIRSYQGGGQKTLAALAYQLALAQATGMREFLMVDEPTDATDSENRDNLLEMMHTTSEFFRQILLITHHGAGLEIAGHVIEVHRDKDKCSYVKT
jgi:exonuclease SbcC